MGESKITLIDLLRESVIVQGILAVMALGGTFWLLLSGHPVDDRIWMVDTAVLGFFFGAKGLANVRGASETSSRFIAEIGRQNAELVQLMLTPAQAGETPGAESDREELR